MAYTPYQLAGTYSSLLDTLQSSKVKEQQSQASLGKQKLKMSEDFQDELEKAEKAAKAKAKKHRGLFGGLNILSSLFLGPIGTAAVKGLTSAGEFADIRKGAKKLLSDVDLERWDKTFLRDSSKIYKKEAEDTQMSTGDILRGAIGGGMTGYAGSKLLGGGEQSPFQKWREGRQASKLMPDIESGYETYSKPFEAKYKDYLEDSSYGESVLSKQDWLDVEEALDKESWAMKNFGEKGFTPEMMKLSESILGSQAPGLSNLWENLTKQGGIKGGMEEMEGAMMLPILLQMMIGGK